MSLALCGLIVILLVAYYLGPREPIDLSLDFSANRLDNDLDTYLSKTESAWSDIASGAQKQIVWANPAEKTMTPYSIIYIHGFSATAAEVRPLPDLIAKNLGANLYFTRLRGHGREDPDAMEEANLNGWINDYAEAIAIGNRIGERVIVMATSTGGSIATWALSQPDLSKNVAAAIFLSPNYGIQAQGSFLLTGPWARRLAHVLLGPRRGFEPVNEAQARHWTYDYPTAAILPMAQSVKLALRTPVEKIATPAFFIISSNDDVVRPDRTRQIAARWGGPHQLHDVGDPKGASTHVLAGDILNPQMTAPIADKITDWLQQTLKPQVR
ncbi:carboxylesterase [Rhizobium sp. L1K21]|uniref:alpha/beta hydrolase n=1 Tax=Rhizobium sp. L1K21 TaxID=2954933 RepID=UPI0020939389|nr:alpha/beta fold hydrolase [Rhizobium sp. L1K21]MCO6185880.1 lysophospholipase [Rhizobium sp. L1K21]